MTENELLPWHIQYWGLGIVTWHGWVVKHEYILHRAFLFDFIFRCGWMLTSSSEVADRPSERSARLEAAVTHRPTTGAQLVLSVDPVRPGPSHPQPLWIYFLMTTQPCLKSGQGSDCKSVQVLAQGSNVSMLPRAGPSLLTMPPVA